MIAGRAREVLLRIQSAPPPAPCSERRVITTGYKGALWLQVRRGQLVRVRSLCRGDATPSASPGRCGLKPARLRSGQAAIDDPSPSSRVLQREARVAKSSVPMERALSSHHQEQRQQQQQHQRHQQRQQQRRHQQRHQQRQQQRQQ
ncbi:unnamed protein product [Lampetra fluviatilis]